MKSDLKLPKSVISVYPALVVIGFSVLLLIWMRDYDGAALRLPQIVAASLLLLGAFDLWSRLPIAGRATIVDIWGASFERREMDHTPKITDEIAIFLWCFSCFLAVAVIGILPTAPLFCFFFICQKDKASWKTAMLVAILTLLFQYVIFEWLLDYKLYRGLLLSKEGFGKW